MEIPSKATEIRGSTVHWAIVDRERVRTELRWKVRGRVLGGAIIAKADSSREDDREQVSQQGCQKEKELKLQLGNSLTDLSL